jgi:hypothetical protein
MERLTKSKKVLDWARDKNDFFCLHDIATFYDLEDQTQLAVTIGKLVQTGKLIKTDIKTGCKLQTKRHSFYIINKEKQKPPVEKPIAKQEEPIAERQEQRTGIKEAIMASVEGQKEPFCIHMIAKDTGETKKMITDYFFLLRKAGLIKKADRNHCPERNANHQFYTAKNHQRAENTKGKKTEMVYEAIKSQRGAFCSHVITKESGVDIMYVQSILHKLYKKRKIRFVGKKPCPDFANIHRFYEHKGKGLRSRRKRRHTRQHTGRPIRIESPRAITIARHIETPKAQIPTYIPQGKIPPENIKQRVELCACCGKKKVIIEIHLVD